MGFKEGREKNKGPRYRVIPPLAEARKLWDTLRDPHDWPGVSGQGELRERAGRSGIQKVELPILLKSGSSLGTSRSFLKTKGLPR